MRANLQITGTPFRNESRLLRESSALAASGEFDVIHIVALHEQDLARDESLDSMRRVHRVHLRSRRWGSSFPVQIIKFVEFCWRVSTYAREMDVTVVNIHSLDLLLLGVLLKWKHHAKLVYDAHELETEIAGLRGTRKWIAKRVETMSMRFVDLLIVVSPGIEQWYRNNYRINRTVTVLNTPVYRQPMRTSRLRDALSIDQHTTVLLYQGGLSRGRGLEQLLTAFERFGDDRYVLVFLGFGALEKMIRAAAARNPRILWHRSVPPGEVIEYTASADIGIAIVDDICLSHRFCLPNKLFEYLMAGLPVMVSDLPEMAAVVSRTTTGTTLRSIDEKGLADALARLRAIPEQELRCNVERAAQAYSWTQQSAVMLSAYREFIFGGGSN